MYGDMSSISLNSFAFPAPLKGALDGLVPKEFAAAEDFPKGLAALLDPFAEATNPIHTAACACRGSQQLRTDKSCLNT